MGYEDSVSQIQLAGFINISARRVRDLEKRGVFKKEKSGKYNLLKSNHSFIAYLREQIQGAGDISLVDARTRKELARAELSELELKKRKGELIDKNLSEQWLRGHVQLAKDGFLNLPRRLGPVLAPIHDEKEIEEVLRTEIFRILSELAAPLRKRGKKIKGR